MTVVIALLAVLAAGPTATAVIVHEPDEVWHIVVYVDDPVRGGEECRQRVIEYAPATCEVQPTSAAPDPYQPGWAR